MSIGPKASQKKFDFLKPPKAVQITKDDTLNAQIFATRIAEETKLSPGARRRQKLANEVATPFFRTTRYAKADGKIPKIRHPKSGEYVSPFSAKGAKTVGGLTLAVARHAHKEHKAKKASIL